MKIEDGSFSPGKEKRTVIAPLIPGIFNFSDRVAAFDFAVQMPSSSVKAQMELS